MEDKFELKRALDHYLRDRPDAWHFLLMYRNYCHAIDDIIDIPERRADNEFILRVLNTSLNIFSSSFYQKYVVRLYPVIQIIHNTYADSVKWEKPEAEAWQKLQSDVLRCCSNEMVCSVVEIIVTEQTGNPELGYEAKRDVSWRAKSQSYFDHHDDKGGAL